MTQNNKNATLLWSAVALGALGVLATYFVAGHARFWANWVLWFILMFTLGLGALFIVALEHLVSARWSVPIRRIPERIATLLLPAIPVGLIALCALPVLYPGSRPEAAHHPILAGKAFWLSLPFFSVRTLLAFGLCLLGLAVLVGGSLKQDTTKDPAFNFRARKFAPAFMAIFALVVTLIAFDWISGLTPSGTAISSASMSSPGPSSAASPPRRYRCSTSRSATASKVSVGIISTIWVPSCSPSPCSGPTSASPSTC